MVLSAGAAERGLGVLPRRAAGRRVARVADRDVAAQRGQGGLVEDLRHEAHVLVDEDLLAVGGRDAGGLLTAVLQRVEPEVGQLGDVLARGPDAEDAAGVLRALLAGKEVMGQVARRRVPLPRFSHTDGVGPPSRPARGHARGAVATTS